MNEDIDCILKDITISDFGTFKVLLNSEIAGPDWIVIQQRINGGEEFNRNWNDYKHGFGDFKGDFFLGLDKIHRLTNDKPHELIIYMERFSGGKMKGMISIARYDHFQIAGEDDKYRLLSLGSFTGNTVEDRLRVCENQKFSTFDCNNMNDNSTRKLNAGWWFLNSATSNLNGKYYQEEVFSTDSNCWDYQRSLKTIKMLIRPRNNQN